ncbi:MAG: type II toxin-antitoxin system VapC family toxin [Planctomycetes bacterium]|nr:type II toxin-antitoxin system VapC family toxin [Planctomycetota bacterium]
MLVLLDSGILLRLVNRSDPENASVRAALRLLKQRGDSLVVAPQNVAEFWNVCTRPASARGGYGLSAAVTAQRLRLLERLFKIVSETPAAYPVWKQLVVNHAVMGVQVHDARLVALMTAQGISHILTFNTGDFARYTKIVAQSPSDVLKGLSASQSP